MTFRKYQDILNEQLNAWDRKKCLKRLYYNWYDRINSRLIPGQTLEIGSGIGKFKEHIPSAVALDVEKTHWTDVVGDARKLPFKTQSFHNMVLFDVLHHITEPKRFFKEAERVLRPGGRVLIMEPYISPASYLVYRFFHPETVDNTIDPLSDKLLSSDHPFDSNQSVATLLFFKYRKVFNVYFPSLKIVSTTRLAFIAYPLSGGFSDRQYLPDAFINTAFQLEKRLGFLSAFLAFRVLIELKKDDEK